MEFAMTTQHTIKPRRRRRSAGAAVVEMAITLSLLTTLTFGSVEFSYYFYVKNMLTQAARQGARAGAPPSGSNSAVTTAVSGALATTNWPASNYTVAITDTSGNAIASVSTLASGNPIEVTVSGTWSTLGAGFRPLNLIGGTKTVSGVSVFMKE